MRVVLDTNILVSALIAPSGNPAVIYDAWTSGKFVLLTCAALLDELHETLRKPKVASPKSQAQSRKPHQTLPGRTAYQSA